MELVKCNEQARQQLANSLFLLDENGSINKKLASYVAKTFPGILLDVARYLIEEATNTAREQQQFDSIVYIRQQLKPYLAFNLLLGKSPQITGLIYNYFEQSSFQPLPENLFALEKDDDKELVVYSHPGFNDDLVKEILLSLFKYLSFNPRWFSSVWNWSELGRFISIHPNLDIRYMAACCLSIITRPTRPEHMSFMRDTIADHQKLIDLQISHRHIFDNTFKPCIETKQEFAEQFADSFGKQDSGYSFCSETLGQVANILLLKRDVEEDDEFKAAQQKVLERYVTVPNLFDTISKIAYSISIDRPCLIRGPCGSGKTAVLDYIAAHTNRLNPPDYVKVQIGDQIDSKMLIGSYVCTDLPGQFEWQPGPLTKAMVYGSWIVFEDIDQAPAEMAQVIHSVIESGNLSCVSSCPIKLDNPHPDFRIFFTQRIARNFESKSNSAIKLGFGFVERLCDIIDLEELTEDDLVAILKKRYKFEELSSTIVSIFKKSQEMIANSCPNKAARIISLRELFKFCERVSLKNLQADAGKFSSSALELIYLDSVECFLSSLSMKDLRESAVALGSLLNISAEDVDRIIFQRSPEVREHSGRLRVGRATLELKHGTDSFSSRSVLAYTRQTSQLVEKIALCISLREPVLLVGETGVGKTSVVQHLADQTKSKLTVVNLSQQSDSSDLLGDYKPVETREIMSPLNQKFEELFKQTFDSESNQVFLKHVSDCYLTSKQNSSWNLYLRLVCKLCTKAFNQPIERTILKSWKKLHERALKLLKAQSAIKESCPMALSFTEGSLLKAVMNGEWILLDEINLAEPEVLQCLLLILDSLGSSRLYMNNLSQDDKPIAIHPNFRMFACMNPSTDVGKRDLSAGTRGRFTEFFVDDITEKKDLRLIVESYVKTCLSRDQIENLVKFYLDVRARKDILNDVSGNSPVHSLRTLCRAMMICSNNVCQNMEKSLYESLRITFLQQLNDLSMTIVIQLMESTVFDKKSITSLKNISITKPKDNHNYVNVEDFWIQTSSETPRENDKYILTESVKKNLKSLARIVSLSQRRLPILIQGNTSVGKTSLIMHMASLTGNKCYRINNHEHTDLQEYVGKYVFKENGKLSFQEGLLVRAMRKGYWIILDELNLAPSELLEALNRALDDNRELFIPETREVVKAHSKFVLFATQNPPEEYAGRKLLSRAFRNRFIELHFDEIPHRELEIILEKRCEMPPQYAKKIVLVMKELQMHRRESGCFNGKNGFMTLRDLFRWGERYALFKQTVADGEFLDWDAHLANEGLILLEGRVRSVDENDLVKRTIEKVFKRALDRDKVYRQEIFDTSQLPVQFKHICFSTEFQRLFVQLTKALKYKEPVLLCGQTGCGKTTACQLYADLNNQQLLTYNCHLNTEGTDFVGGVRPSRSESVTKSIEDGSASRQTFPWVDGPLVQAMKQGHIFLMDEISLADDAVLERINSVLEPARSLTLTEKDGQEIHANESFRLIATMNPGGDYGKKELSPALRNRFTEIYCHNTTDLAQISKIIEKYLIPALLKPKIAPVLKITQEFLQEYYKEHSRTISIRDVLSWCQFMNKTTNMNQPKVLSVQEAITHGASLVYFDQFGTCGHKTLNMDSIQPKSSLRKFLNNLVINKLGKEPIFLDRIPDTYALRQDSVVCFMKFYLNVGPYNINLDKIKGQFVCDTPMVKKNIMKIVRAMQLDRPILLEGNPGAGKTSVVETLAKLTGHKLIRINLSEQTDVSDLFGSDLPDLVDDVTSESKDQSPKFSWHDGPMLKAIKDSDWVLLDEMNLASQSVLEGLNACFDHRGELFIPELNKKFKVDRSNTRIFACQNPYSQGAARKGLPQSFLNRFTSIYIESHSSKDLIAILRNLYPVFPVSLIEKMVIFNEDVCSLAKYSGFEFNLRDLIHWCELLNKHVKSKNFIKLELFKPEKFVQFVYLDRMRSADDQLIISDIFEKIFGRQVYEPPYRDIRIGEHTMIIARSILPRKTRLPPHLQELCILKYQLPYIESIAKAIEHNRMPIIVGETGAGKRSIIKILAGLTGNELNTICANEEMDVIELLGSYEQKSFQRDIADLVEEAKNLVNKMINSISHKSCPETWTKLFNNVWAALYATSLRNYKISKSEMIDAYSFQLSQLKELIGKIRPMCHNRFDKRCYGLLRNISRLVERSDSFRESDCASGSFEWIDSVLIRSIKEGAWLMIENANLMNPATLDRLNSLVEYNGSISLNEKGSCSDGCIEVLKPHPDFRLILTINPEHGELSRAMRNRGVEICVQTRFYFEDFLILLDQNGFEPEEQKACMTYCVMQTSYDFHQKITKEVPEEDGAHLAYFGLNYISTLTHEVRRGKDIDSVLFNLLTAYYKQKGYVEECSDELLREFIVDKLNVYRSTYEVNLLDERYKWRHLRHDLVSLTGGDAVTAMLDRDNRIFFDDFNIELLLKPDEIIENIDIVNTCITVKIFLELATHGDFEYRKGFIRETFLRYPNMMATVNSHVDVLHKEYVPLIESLSPRTNIAPISEMLIDTRNSPDIHYYLQAIDDEGLKKQEGHQNRWILSLHRIMLRMIVEMVEERSASEATNNTSLYTISELHRTEQITREDLIRPIAAIASDLYDLLDGILRVVSNRCFANDKVAHMLPKLFWLSYFICKLKRHYSRDELISICNQIPMLWTLTYQKVIEPIMTECKMADLVYKNKKFSQRIDGIRENFESPSEKQEPQERNHYKKVINHFAATSKFCDVTSREVDRFFSVLIGRYTSRSHSFSLSNTENEDTLIASGLTWSNSTYMKTFYTIEDKLLIVELAEKAALDDINVAKSGLDRQISDEARNHLKEKQKEYDLHEEWLNKTQAYRSKCMNVNRRRNALDQFAPIWQYKLLQRKLSTITPNNLMCIDSVSDWLQPVLSGVNGIIMSPKYYSTLIKYLRSIDNRRKELNQNDSQKTNSNFSVEDLEMFSAYLADYLAEVVILDNQLVGWTKLRTTTSDLPSLAPLVPEYSPIVSLVGGYCLDIGHLKLNSYLNSSPQLESMIVYLRRRYAQIKHETSDDMQNISMARHLLHLRFSAQLDRDLFNPPYECNGQDNCDCIDEFIRKRSDNYPMICDTIDKNFDAHDATAHHKAMKLIFFGYSSMLEYAPIFTIDPSIRSREKLEVYKSELAHIKLELHFRNTLFYWKTGENLQLNEIDSDEASLFPFSTRALVDRRVKLEKSINKLRREHTNRPKTDDGSIYHELKKEIEFNMSRFTFTIQKLITDFVGLATCSDKSRSRKLMNIITQARRIIKSLEKTISRIRTDYSIYSELTTNFIVGLGFQLQGVRCLYARFEQTMQTRNFGFSQHSIQKFMDNISCVFSFNKFLQGNIESVYRKLEFYPKLNRVCPAENVSQIQSLVLRTVLLQLNHHIIINPSEIQKCFPIVRYISDLFHKAWLTRKQHFEEQRRLREELYHYKTSKTTLGAEVSYERQEFLDICANFPTYEHVYQSFFKIPPTSADVENLNTEEKMCNLNRCVDLSQCIDICKAHYKFIKEASCNLLGHVDLNNCPDRLPTINLSQMIELEAEVLYTITRHCIPLLDQSFDSASLECHLLRAKQLNQVLKQQNCPDRVNKITESQSNLGSLKSSIDILDEKIFDIYHNANAYEAMKFQEFICKIDTRISHLRNNQSKSYDFHPTLMHMLKLITRISSFLLTDPLMKFVTGSHTLFEKIDEWNHLSIPKEDKMINEADELVDLIQSWRRIEIESWRSSLHRVKKKFIDGTLCDLWFKLYKAFNDPIVCVKNIIRVTYDDAFIFNDENSELFYQGFVFLIKNFFEESTLGDYQIRLDLVSSFAIQMRFATIYKQARPDYSSSKHLEDSEKSMRIDFEKLASYVYNVYRQYVGLYEPVKEVLEGKEAQLLKELNTEIKIVAWQGRNLWEIKNSFRISHRKLNKVMRKYLEVLKQSLPGLKPANYIPNDDLVSPSNIINVERLSLTLISFRLLVDNVKIPEVIVNNRFDSLCNTPKTVKIMKQLYSNLSELLMSKHIENLTLIEDSYKFNADAIQNFNCHKVEEVLLLPSDTKEVKESKHKLCRQMYHSKKFSLQSIFKNLAQLGLRHQRGLNNQPNMDCQILSLEPLRGVVQKQSQTVLQAASKLIDDHMISVCNDLYLKLIARNLYLMSRERPEDVTGDQMDRIQGYSLDMVIDLIKHLKIAAEIYRHLMDIQACSICLRKLEESIESETTIISYNFDRVRQSIISFNELVGRAYLLICKLDELSDCYKMAPEQELMANGQNPTFAVSGDAKLNVIQSEKILLTQMIYEVEENNSLMTKNQLDCFKNELVETKKMICDISYRLRDMLNYTDKNYIFSGEDLNVLGQLFNKFSSAFERLTPSSDDSSPNVESGTILGSMRLLLNEARQQLEPKLRKEYLQSNSEEIENNDSIVSDITQHPNFERLNSRSRKLVKQIKLAMQYVYKRELAGNDSGLSGEDAKRANKPFNYLDSICMRNLLRVEKVAECCGDFFRTINLAQECHNMNVVVTNLTPVLFVYTQEVATYLNIILTSIHSKLKISNQLISFFNDILSIGFGLPQKISPEDSGLEGQKTKPSEDNTGFGDGQGDTDVSKKLEFESQLDDLKKNDENANGVENEQSTKSHDDGVEMSEDIDAKAEGAGEDDAKSDDDDQIPDNENEDQLNDLDKEMDEVDQDEGQLDNKLWDDEDENSPEEEDTKEDLRETNLDNEIPKQGEEDISMLAKDDQLAESKSDNTESAANDLEDDDSGDDDDPVQEHPKNDNVPEDEPLNSIEERDEEGLDLDREADLAKEASEKVDEAETDGDGDLNLSVEMDDGLESISDTESMALNADEDLDEKSSLSDGEGNKSEGELDPDSGSSGDELLDSENIIDEDELHNQLEAGVNTNRQDPSRHNTDQSAAKSQNNQNDGADDKKQSKGGGGVSEIYQVFSDEEFDDDLSDVDDDNMKNGAQDLGDGTKPQEEDNFTSPSANEQPVNSNNEVNENNQKEVQSSEVEEKEEDKGIKRPINAEETERKDIKRQRIAKNHENNKKQRVDDEGINHDDDQEKKEMKNYDGQVKHSNKDTSKTHEIIDILSSDDDEGNCLKNVSDENEIDDNKAQQTSIMEQIDNELGKKLASQTRTDDEHDSLETDRLTSLWIDCTRQIGHLVYELCQQLQIVLQPTKMAKYKGDYKSGKRLNMRKIISYIASMYMKDKIWLRRTKPSKRTYNIMIAVDNSSSMHENNCRQMTYQSLALLAKSLSIIEAGSLNVVKFGEQYKCIHEFGQPYMDAIGAQWLRELRFTDSKTSYAKLLKNSTDAFEKQARMTNNEGSSNSSNQLLIVLSDGRNVSSEEDEIKNYLKQLKSMEVLTLFIVIDDLKRNNNISIVDVKRPIGIGANLKMMSYMELFPFPFYVLLRNLESMPSVLGDALRQWFELVSSYN